MGMTISGRRVAFRGTGANTPVTVYWVWKSIVSTWPRGSAWPKYFSAISDEITTALLFGSRFAASPRSSGKVKTSNRPGSASVTGSSKRRFSCWTHSADVTSRVPPSTTGNSACIRSSSGTHVS